MLLPIMLAFMPAMLLFAMLPFIMLPAIAPPPAKPPALFITGVFIGAFPCIPTLPDVAETELIVDTLPPKGSNDAFDAPGLTLVAEALCVDPNAAFDTAGVGAGCAAAFDPPIEPPNGSKGAGAGATAAVVAEPDEWNASKAGAAGCAVGAGAGALSNASKSSRSTAGAGAGVGT